MKYQSTILESFPVSEEIGDFITQNQKAVTIGTIIPISIFLNRFLISKGTDIIGKQTGAKFLANEQQGVEMMRLIYKADSEKYTIEQLTLLDVVKSQLISNKSVSGFIKMIDAELYLAEQFKGVFFKTVNKIVSPILGVVNNTTYINNLNFIKEFMLKK